MTDIIRLSNDFVDCVKRYGKVIIAEHSVPVPAKTIKPTRVGGVIGGEKYIVQSILFKGVEDLTVALLYALPKLISLAYKQCANWN